MAADSTALRNGWMAPRVELLKASRSSKARPSPVSRASCDKPANDVATGAAPPCACMYGHAFELLDGHALDGSVSTGLAATWTRDGSEGGGTSIKASDRHRSSQQRDSYCSCCRSCGLIAAKTGTGAPLSRISWPTEELRDKMFWRVKEKLKKTKTCDDPSNPFLHERIDSGLFRLSNPL